jgi:hypothetical protein
LLFQLATFTRFHLTTKFPCVERSTCFSGECTKFSTDANGRLV